MEGRFSSPRAIAGLVLVLTIALGVSAGLHRIHSPLFDAVQQYWPRPITELPVVIVTIDEHSLSKYGQWPWPRSLTARLLDAIKAQDPVAIGLDIVMAEPDRLSPVELLKHHPQSNPDLRLALASLPANDNVLARSFAAGSVPVVAGNGGLPNANRDEATAVVLTPMLIERGAFVGSIPNYRRVLRNVPVLRAAAAGHGLLNSIIDSDGTVRRIPLLGRIDERVFPSLATELLRVAQGAQHIKVSGDEAGIHAVTIGGIQLPTGNGGDISLRFSVTDARRFVSAATLLDASDVGVNVSGAGLDASPAGGALTDKLVLLGVTALGLTDAPPTPVSPRMDGIEIQAQLLENLLQESWLTRPEFSLWVEVLVGLSAGLLVIIVIPMCSPVRAVLIVVALTGALLAASSVALVRASVLIDALPPVLYLAAAAISLGVLQWVASERSRRTLGLALATERLQRARLDGELDAARNIQQGFLPDASRFDMPPGCSLAAYLEPAAEVGGDLYDIARLEDGRLFIVLGDVSGKGVAASLFMAVSKTLCKSIALRGSLGADEILTLANSEISRENPELLFVTAVVALVNTTTGEIEVANAGHDAPVVIRPGRTPRRLSVAGGPPLCALDDFTYSSVFERLEAGETLVLTTDGVSEAINPEGEFFGYDGLSAALTQVHDDADATAITQHIRTTLTDFARGAPPNDDIAVLTFHYG